MERRTLRSRLLWSALAASLLVGLCAAPPVLLERREGRITRFCTTARIGDDIEGVERRAARAGFSVQAWSVGKGPQRRFLKVGEEPFAELFLYCCVRAEGGAQVSDAGLCVSG